MKIIYHMGAHGTEEDLILRVLLRNRSRLSGLGIAIPPPSRYRQIVIEAIRNLRGAPASPEMQEMLLDALLEDEKAERIILSYENFLATPGNGVGQSGLYPFAGERPQFFANLFPGAESEFHMALRHPAGLVHTLLQRQPQRSYEDVMGDIDPRALRWAPVVRRMLAGAGGHRLVLWCSEDAPLIWPEVIRRICGVSPEVPILGNVALLARLLGGPGLDWLNQEAKTNPPTTIAARRALVSRALELYANEDELEVTLPFPGWDEALLAQLDRNYDADIAEIAALPGVEFIAP